MTEDPKETPPQEVHTELRKLKTAGKAEVKTGVAKRSKVAVAQAEEDDLLDDLFNDMPV